MRIALAGNPNSGKTTMFNALTGRNEKVGNWAGVTVDKKTHIIKKRFHNSDEDIIAVDLPGAYSLSPFTSEESVTSDYIKTKKPDAIINIVDATNLSRSLFFTTQLLELGIPTVVALNKSDVNEKRENTIDAKALSDMLGCPVIETVSTSKKGISLLVEAAIASVGKGQSAPFVDTDADYSTKDGADRSDKKRYEFVNGIVTKVERRKFFTKDRNIQDKVDAVLTNKWIGLPIFAFIMFLVFGISQAWLGPLIADLFSSVLESGQSLVADALSNESGELGIWSSILVDGIIGGVIAVVGFLPLVMIMFFLSSLLEDCGYMARATVVLDPIFKKVGLSGKSVIPFIMGTGCSVPGIMACRTVRDERERKSAAMLTPFMPCGAKLPVISLFAGAFFGESAWVGTLMYFAGILIILIGAFVINIITGYKKKNFFIMELPEYRLPSIKRGAYSMLGRAWAFIEKAGTIILVCNFIIHIMQTFNWQFEVVDSADSILHDVATPFAYVLAPIVGVVAWQLAAAAITGFIAKENVVGTLAVCYGISNLINSESQEIVGSANEVAVTFGITSAAALAFLMFNLFSPPCFAAIGAMNAEMKDKKWFWSGIGLQLGTGYAVSFLVYFFGTLISGEKFTDIWMPIVGFAIFAVLLAILLTLILLAKKRVKSTEVKKETVTV